MNSEELNIWGRPSWDNYWLAQAAMVAARATCRRRMVGCVLVSADNRLLSTGYNGTEPGTDHCLDYPCEGASLPSGQGLHLCKASHAELNAKRALKDVNAVETAYLTASPCEWCVAELLETSCRRIVFIEEYPHQLSKTKWEESGRIWMKAPDETWKSVLNSALKFQDLIKKRREN